jgi:uncharacterized repeat protein (TIGR03803 family)
VGALTKAFDGNFYGATHFGGINNNGTIFRLSPSGAVTTVHQFSGLDGTSPSGTLLSASDGSLYGVTGTGGPNGSGTLFRMKIDGGGATLETLYAFNGGDGAGPLGVVETPDHTFYGVTGGGGSAGGGTLFRLLDFSLTTLHLFEPADGTHPSSVPIVGSDGKLYGTTITYGGAPNASGSVYAFDPAAPRAPVLNFTKTCHNEFDICLKPFNTAVGGTISLDWSTANVTACFASGAWRGQKPTGGDFTFVAAAPGVFTYRLTCVGRAGNVTATQTVTVIR